ncbi:hypothetical protein Hanom_Chr07g00583211 [Helianthus anomalus]
MIILVLLKNLIVSNMINFIGFSVGDEFCDVFELSHIRFGEFYMIYASGDEFCDVYELNHIRLCIFFCLFRYDVVFFTSNCYVVSLFY